VGVHASAGARVHGHAQEAIVPEPLHPTDRIGDDRLGAWRSGPLLTVRSVATTAAGRGRAAATAAAKPDPAVVENA
jgi:hypothetical protein